MFSFVWLRFFFPRARITCACLCGGGSDSCTYLPRLCAPAQIVEAPLEVCVGCLIDVSAGRKFVYTYPPSQKSNAVLSMELAYIRAVKSDPTHPSQHARKYWANLDRGPENHNRYRLGQCLDATEFSLYLPCADHVCVCVGCFPILPGAYPVGLGLCGALLYNDFFEEIETHSLVEGHTFGICDQLFSVCTMLSFGRARVCR